MNKQPGRRQPFRNRRSREGQNGARESSRNVTSPTVNLTLSAESVLALIQTADRPLDKKEIARILGVRGDDRITLKNILRRLEEKGDLSRPRGHKVQPPGTLPDLLFLEIIGFDKEGEALCRPLDSKKEVSAPIYLRGSSLDQGARFLGSLRRLADGTYHAKMLRALERHEKLRLVGLVQWVGKEWRLTPTDRRQKSDLLLIDVKEGSLTHGELALVECLPSLRLGLKQARVIERLGPPGAPRAASLVALHAHGIPTVFPEEALNEAAAAKPVTLGKREDLRPLPLVTIDGEDARDFDDAVFAESDKETPGQFHLIVAIADVAHYVKSNSALDQTALERGNSVYFPDRVVPMLPEALSNDLCSLRPHEDRACLAVHLWVDAHGALKRWKFVRGLMRSAARLTYEEAQAAIDGHGTSKTEPLLAPVLRPLYAAFKVLHKARVARGTLDLEVTERKVVLHPSGEVASVRLRERLDSHRLIEEFMICANVASALALGQRGGLCLYRVHDAPPADRLETLAAFLRNFGIKLSRGERPHARQLAHILEKFRGKPEIQLISEMMLRSQAQAVYSPENIGHFGLALDDYAHFTSPIRRYADLIVHRALIRAYQLGDGALETEEAGRLPAIADQITSTERRAVAAEREASERYLAAHLEKQVGAEFKGRISGVQTFGLFIRLDETGAEGLLPIRRLPNDFYHHDPVRQTLTGKRNSMRFQLFDSVTVRLAEVDTHTGTLSFDWLGDGKAVKSRGRLAGPQGAATQRSGSKDHPKNHHGGRHHPQRRKPRGR